MTEGKQSLCADVPPKAGHWCILIVGPAHSWDRTALGLAVYDADGNLAWSRIEGIEKAEKRGDWKPEWFRPSIEAPKTWAHMERRLGSTSNAMSSIRWEGGLATTNWSSEVWERSYEIDILGAGLQS